MHPVLSIVIPLASSSIADAISPGLGLVGCLAAGAMVLALWCYTKVRAATKKDAPKAAPASEQLPNAPNPAPEPTPVPEPKPAPEPTPEPAPEPAPIPEAGQIVPAAAQQPADKPTEPATSTVPTAPTAKSDDPSSPEQTEPERDLVDTQEQAFDYDEFVNSLLLSRDPIATLKERVGSIRTRMATGQEDAVLPAERFLARQLEEAELFSTSEEEDLPHLHVVLPRHSRTIYLRMPPKRLPWGAYLRVLRIEAALNALHFAHKQLEDLNQASERELYRVVQRLTNSVCAQAPNVETVDWSYLAMPWQSPTGPSQRGEWAVRFALSEAIESAQVPHRLEAQFRVNVAGGDVAIELKATPQEVFARSAWVDGLGIVPTTKAMRAREASKYAARLGLLLANHAFRASEHVRRVWVAANLDSPDKHSCLYSLCIDRRAMARIRMEAITDPLATLRTLGAELVEEDGALQSSEQCFQLSDERFCPSLRHDLWQLSERSLPATAAFSLGASRISDLEIHEELPRSVAAERMISKLGDPHAADATQRSVKTIMDVARDTSDVSVWSAAERLVYKLVDGSLSPDNTDALVKEIVEGDTLTKTYDLARRYLDDQKIEEAMDLLNSCVKSIDKSGGYEDTKAVVYRCFNNFTERVMYNRLNHRDHRALVLVPDAYVMAHLTLAALLISIPREQGGSAALALEHAQRALELAPLGLNANLAVVACWERLGDFERARQCLVDFLQTAFFPQSIGLAYYRLAAIEWALGNHKACQASYQRSTQLFPALLPAVLAECQTLAARGAKFSDHMDEEETERILIEQGIPLAPTERMSFYLYDGATASVDAEVFPVARDLVGALEAFSGDDVVRGIRKSLEYEPDR